MCRFRLKCDIVTTTICVVIYLQASQQPKITVSASVTEESSPDRRPTSLGGAGQAISAE
jgi:hypothetical protein